MATFAFSNMAPPQGATFVFGSWVCIASGSGGFDSHLTNSPTLKAASPESLGKLAESDDQGIMLLPYLTKEIEMKLEDNLGSTRTQIDLKLISTRIGTPLAQPLFGLRNSSSTYKQMIRSIYENSLDHLLCGKNHSVTASREAPIFDIYPDPVESSQDSLDFITNALVKIQLESCESHTLAELLDNLRKVASIDDLPFQHSTPLVTERETRSGGTILADYESDMESFSPERLVPVIIQQPGGAPSQHDPNEALDQISEDNLTLDAPQDEDESTRTARRVRNQHKGERRVQATERARLPPRNLNNKFNNVADPVFRTPIAAMTEATLRLMQMPQNSEMEHVIKLAKNVVEQLERQNPLSSLHGTQSRATATVIPQDK